MNHAPARLLVLAAFFATVLGGCRFGAEGTFTAGATYDACDSSIPVCNTTAACKLVEEDGYTDGEFPGFKQLIIPTAGEAVIRIKLFWRTQLSPGADTEILWYEPACVEVFRWESQGVDIFDQTGRDGIWQEHHRVYREGDHLVEIRSDATGEYVLRPEVLTVDEFELEQASLFDLGEDPQ
jgi:hypothetical protein